MDNNKPEMFSEFEKDFEIWYKSKSESFLYITKRSCPFRSWYSYVKVKNNERYKDSPIKPINNYAMNLYQAPELVSITGNVVRLRQQNHAEMFLLIKKDGSFYNIDRPWIRQYYLSDKEYQQDDQCFEGIFRFYVPWVLDFDVTAKILRPEVESPFLIYEDQITFKKIPGHTEEIDAPFVHFHFKNVGPHMIEEGFGKIKRLSPMYDIEFEINDIMILDNIKEFYEKTKV